ncbi:MAG: hypothetical protein IT427_18625 [Pirellulales bacterium]|nr:hypothetical protein [Pirellulales bacterium]
MNKAEFKSQVSILMLPLAASMWFIGAQARGDGGTLRVSRCFGDLQVSVFTAPASPRVGMFDVSVLVQDATSQAICDRVPVQIRLEHSGGEIRPMQATAASATNRLFKSAPFDVMAAGIWRVTVLVHEPRIGPLSFDVEIAPPLPPWIWLAPWIGWPFGLVALFLIHQRLAMAQRTRHAPAGQHATLD